MFKHVRNAFDHINIININYNRFQLKKTINILLSVFQPYTSIPLINVIILDYKNRNVE